MGDFGGCPPPFTEGGPPVTEWPATGAGRLRILQVMSRRDRWLTGVALVGAVASVLAVGMLWLVATRSDAVATTLGVWLSAR